MGALHDADDALQPGETLPRWAIRNTAALERLLADVQALPGVRGTQTSIILSSLKETSSLVAEPMQLHPLSD